MRGAGPALILRGYTEIAALIQQALMVVRAIFERLTPKVSAASSLPNRPMARASVPSLACVGPAIAVFPCSMSRQDTAHARGAACQTQAHLFKKAGLVAQPVKYKHPQKARQQSDPNQPLLTHLICGAFPLTDHMHQRPFDQQLGSPSPGVVVAGHAHAVRAC